jgi:glutamine amidotransferase
MLARIGAECRITSDAAEVAAAAKVILPGVGAFDEAMTNLRSSTLVPVLQAKVEAGAPVLGICLGMQLLGHGSEEGTLPGLAWLDADTVKFQLDGTDRRRLPHMGWSTIAPCRTHPLLEGLPADARFYFVHSYHVRCRNPGDVVAESSFGSRFHSIVAHGNVMGTQFHPEKSHAFGLRLLANFAAL